MVLLSFEYSPSELVYLLIINLPSSTLYVQLTSVTSLYLAMREAQKAKHRPS